MPLFFDANTCATAKAELRTRIRRDRRARVGTSEVMARDRALRVNMGRLLATVVGEASGDRPLVCAYSPLADEPGGAGLVEFLLDAAGDRCAILLPRIVPGTRRLEWAEITGGVGALPAQLRRNTWGIWEPLGPAIPDALGRARVVFLPALAVSPQGHRLGQGGGFYDRALPLRGQGCRVCAVVDASEVREDVPYEAHDVVCDVICTDEGWWEVSTGDFRGGC